MDNIRKILVTFFVLVFTSAPSFASVYTIKDIEVKQTGENATKAREKAILEGQKEAFYKLLKKTTPDFLHHALPEMTEEEISPLVIGQEIENEKVTANTYKATLSISFNPDYIKKIIEDSGLTSVDSKKKPIIVIPQYSNEGILDVASSDNYWRQAWQNAKNYSDFINFIFVNDQLEIDFENPLYSQGLPDDEKIKVTNLLDKYNSDKIIIAKADYTPDSDAPIFVKLIFISDDSIDQTSKRFSIQPDDQLPEKLEDIALSLVEKMNKKWKKNQGQRKSAKLKINVNVPISGLSQWNAIKKQLNKLAFIDKIDINKISIQQADLDLHFQTSYEDFLYSLSKEGLYIESENDGLFLKRYKKGPPIENNQQDMEYEQINGFEG